MNAYCRQLHLEAERDTNRYLIPNVGEFLQRRGSTPRHVFLKTEREKVKNGIETEGF